MDKYKPQMLHIDDLVSILEGFFGFFEIERGYLERAEIGERILNIDEASLKFYWNPFDKNASVISVVGRRDYKELVKLGEVWKQVTTNIAKRNDVRFDKYIHGYRFMQKKVFLEEGDDLKTEIDRIITAQRELDTLIEKETKNEVTRILAKL